MFAESPGYDKYGKMKKRPAMTLPAVARFGRWRLAFFTATFVALSVAVPCAMYLDLGGQGFALDGQLLSLPFLAAVAAMLVVYFGADGLRLHHTLKALGHALPKRHLGRLVFINILFSNLTPMATGGGFAQIWYLRRHGIHLGTATAATTLRTLLAMLFIFALTPFLVHSMPFFQASIMTARFAASFSLFAGAYLGFFLLLLFRLRWVLMAADRVLMALHRCRIIDGRRRRRWHFRLRREMIRFSWGMKAYLKGARRDILLSVLYTALFLLTLFSFPSLVLWGLHQHVDYLTTTGMLAVATFIMYFSPTPGGAGFAEGVFRLFFASMIAPSELVLVIVAWRFLTIYLGMLIGVPVVLHEMAGKGPDDG